MRSLDAAVERGGPLDGADVEALRTFESAREREARVAGDPQLNVPAIEQARSRIVGRRERVARLAAFDASAQPILAPVVSIARTVLAEHLDSDLGRILAGLVDLADGGLEHLEGQEHVRSLLSDLSGRPDEAAVASAVAMAAAGAMVLPPVPAGAEAEVTADEQDDRPDVQVQARAADEGDGSGVPTEISEDEPSEDRSDAGDPPSAAGVVAARDVPPVSDASAAPSPSSGDAANPAASLTEPRTTTIPVSSADSTGGRAAVPSDIAPMEVAGETEEAARPTRSPEPAAAAGPEPLVTGPAQNAASGHEVTKPAHDVEDDVVSDPSAQELSAVVALVREGRDGLAAWTAQAAGASEQLVLALRVLALSASVGPDPSTGSAEARAAIVEVATALTDFEHGERLIVLAAAVPVACLAPHLGAAQLIEQHALTMAEEPALAALVAAVGETAAKGIAFNDALLGTARDAAEHDGDLRNLSRRAARIIEHPAQVKLPRGSELMREFVRGPGPFADMLVCVRDDARDRASATASAVADLGGRRAIAAAIDDWTGKRTSPSRRKPIIGEVREKLITACLEIIDLAGEWADLVASMQGPSSDAAWMQGAVDAVRAAAQRLRSDGVSADWAGGDDLAAAGAARLSAAAEEVCAMVLDGRRPDPSPRSAALCLNGELLRDPDLRLDPDTLEPRRPPTVDQLLRLRSAPDWAAAVDARARRGDSRLVDVLLALPGGPGGDEDLERRAQHALDDARREVDHRREREVGALVARFQQGAVDPDDWVRLTRRAQELGHPDRADEPGDAMDAVGAFSADIAAAVELQVSVRGQELLDELRACKAGPEREQALKRALDDADVTAAEAVVLASNRGEEGTPPVTVHGLLERVFPDLSDRLVAAGADAASLAEQVRATGRVDAMDATPLTQDQRPVVAAGLLAVARLDAVSGESHDAVDEVLALLGLIGSAAASAVTDGWRVFDAEARVSDKAVVPDFGSRAAGRYRVLLPLGRDETEDRIGSWLDGHPTDRPTLILTPRVFPTRLLLRLAERARRAGQQQALVCDLALLTAVAVLGPGSFEHTARLALPFTALNPYDPYSIGNVPEEMFFGRQEEMENLLAPTGDIAYVYGGRRLGKSALLRAAARTAESRHGELVARFIDLQDKGVGDYQEPATTFTLIEDALDDILPESKRRIPEARLEERVKLHHAAGGRRLLILLDEADRMIDVDAEQGFRVMSSLRRLQEDTEKHIRFVFAGLHSVRRFQDVRNQRLFQFGRSVSIGSLAPLDARKLLERPLEALGYRLEDRSVTRILTLTQNQPSLIQLVCEELVRDQHGRSRLNGGPPWEVTHHDIESVLALPRLTREITARFESTIRLDERYRVIALVIAYLAAEEGMDALFEIGTIRAQCHEWWPAGFADTSSTEFETLLEEMQGLSVLYSADERYGLHSPHVSRMLGTQKQLEDRLVDAGTQPAPRRTFDGIAFRQALPPRRRGDAPGYRLSPLNLRAVSRLQARSAFLCAVVASDALDRADLPAALEALVGADDDIDVMWVGPLSDDAERNRFLSRLRTSGRGRHRVTVAELGDVPPTELAELLRRSAELVARPSPRQSSKGLIIVDPPGLATWRTLMEDGVPTARGVVTLPLRRHTLDSLRTWGRRQEVHLPVLENPETAANLLAETGGWPSLVDLAVANLQRNHDVRAAVDDVRAHLDDVGHEGFATAAGLTADPVLAETFDRLTEIGDGESVEDALEWLTVDGLPAHRAAARWSLLTLLGAVEQDEAGHARCDPLLARRR